MTTQEEYVDRAKVQLAQTHQHIHSMAEANKAVHKAARAGTISAHGQASFATVFLYGTTVVQLTFNDGTKMTFEGKQWGLGIGGGTSYGGGVFSVPPNELKGSCNYETHSAAGGVSITWWRDKLLLGTFVGAALAVDVSITGGSGEWYDN